MMSGETMSNDADEYLGVIHLVRIPRRWKKLLRWVSRKRRNRRNRNWWWVGVKGRRNKTAWCLIWEMHHAHPLSRAQARYGRKFCYGCREHTTPKGNRNAR